MVHWTFRGAIVVSIELTSDVLVFHNNYHPDTNSFIATQKRCAVYPPRLSLHALVLM